MKIKLLLSVSLFFFIFFNKNTYPQETNIAVNGTPYVWTSNSDEFSDQNKVVEPEINNENLENFLWLKHDANGDMVVEPQGNVWQAVGIVWDTPQSSINRVIFTNGPFDGTSSSDGAFTASFHIQISTDGVTWQNIAITPTPEYEYYVDDTHNGAAVSNADFVFEGDFGTVKGVRVLGKVRTSEEYGSFDATCRELKVLSQSNSTGQAPQITSHPQSQTKNVGETATFSVTATGSEPLAYQWYLNGSEISGATESSYTTPSLTAQDNGNQYYCIVTNDYGTATSNTATLTVNSTTDSSTLTNIAINGTPYVWNSNLDEFSDNNKTVESEINNESLINFLWLKHDSNGDMSPEMSIGVWQAVGIVWDSPQSNIQKVVFTNGPFDGGDASDGAFTANFHIQISTDGTTWQNINITSNPEYEYYVDDTHNGASVSDADFVFEGDFGTVKGIRVLGQVHTTDGVGSYDATCRELKVLAGNSSGEAPQITSQPQSQTKNVGETATFSVTATGSEPLAYQWYLNDSEISGATESSYTTASLTTEDNGNRYYCVVTNDYGSATSETATLTVNSGDDLVLVENGIAQYVIYYGAEESQIVEHAAYELGMRIDQITGSNMVVTTDQNAGDKLIIVGRNNPLTSAISDLMDFAAIKDDGFRILTHDGNLYIAGAIDRGTMYGVYHLLDIYFGVRWFSPEFEVIPSKSTLTVPQTNDLQNPRFAYREVFNGDTDDGYFRAHNRLNGNRWGTHRQDLEYDPDINDWSKDGPAGGHNMEDIVSSAYHYGGQILMMEEGARADAENYFVDLINNEGDEYWFGFSQEDRGWEPDPASQSFADAHGGYLSAPVIDIVSDVANRVRQTHPNAHLSTSAYQWSFHPPTDLTVPEYVMVEISPIEANFGYPYNDNINNPEIKDGFDGWAQIAPTLGVWDYITNFQNYLQPLPTIYPMCQNIQYMANIDGIKSYFGEGSYNTVGAEFAELRAWVASRLLWNPNQDYMELINEFCDGYYGPASSYIKQYLDLLHQSFQQSNDRISSKQRITSDYLNLDFIMQADELMASADAAATGEYAKHVHEVRLGVDMTILLREHLYEAEAQERGIEWTHDPDRRARFNQYSEEANITYYSEDALIDALYAAMDIERVNPPDPDVVSEDDEWIDFQDLDFSICCGAVLVQDDLASDHGAAKLDKVDWAITLKLDLLPPGDQWTLYAYVRVNVKPGANPDDVAFNMGIDPGSWISPKVSEVQDGQYHVFEFPEMPVEYQTGRDVWLNCDTLHSYSIFVDRIIAVKNNGLSKVVAPNNGSDILDNNLPKEFALHENFPNPFNPITTIKYDLPKESKVKLIIFDVTGRKIATLVDGVQAAGYKSIHFDATNLASGIYFYLLQAEDFSKVKRMLLLK